MVRQAGIRPGGWIVFHCAKRSEARFAELGGSAPLVAEFTPPRSGWSRAGAWPPGGAKVASGWWRWCATPSGGWFPIGVAGRGDRRAE